MTRAIKIFEPVTDEQIKKIHAVARKIGLADVDMYQMVAGLIGVASVTALSQQEALFLIDKMQGKNKRRYPAVPLFSDKINGDTSSLPSFYHIRDIRLMVQELGWDKQQLKDWLTTYRKVKDIRSMDRTQARKTWFILQGMVAKKCGGKQAKQ